jgi:hypothetical protein
VAIGEDAARRLPQGAGLRPDVGLRRGDRDSTGPIGVELAEALHENFVEVLSPPATRTARSSAAAEGGDPHPLRGGARQADPAERDVKTGLGGLLIQDRDGDPEPRELMEAVTDSEPSEAAVGGPAASPGPSSATSAPTRS